MGVKDVLQGSLPNATGVAFGSEERTKEDGSTTIDAPLPEVEVHPDAVREKGALDPKGNGVRSLFALRMKDPSRPGGVEIPKVAASNIVELLELLPVQTEIVRLERKLRRVEVVGRIRVPPLPELLERLPPALRSAMEEIPKLTRFLNPVELFTADDVAKKKDEFLEKASRGILENPTFTYEQSTAALKRTLDAHGLDAGLIERRLRAIEAEIGAVSTEDPLAKLVKRALLRKVADDLATLELYAGLVGKDDRRVKRAVVAKYGRGVDEPLFEAARIVYGYLVATEAHSAKKRAKLEGRIEADVAAYMAKSEQMTAEDFAGAVEWMLDRFYAHYEETTGRPFPEASKFRIDVSDKYSGIDVRDKSSEGPVIGIPAKARSYKQYLELLRHEIDCHVRQSFNGQLMLGFGGGALKVDEETWYEGLAKLHEIAFMREMFGDESSPALPYYTFAIRLAEEGKSFVQVFEAIREMRLAAGNSDEKAAANAWNATYRVFRGHIDTANREAYALPKDQAYLRGWMLATQLEAGGLGYLNEAAISDLGGLELIAELDLGPKALLFPDLNLTDRYFDEVMKPRILGEMAK